MFLASLSTILGAVLFLRFGYAVGHAGVLGTLLIILLGHAVTIPTALAIGEIATNRRVEGGGEYFIISRSFGTAIGAAIGVSLYLSQAISVAFHMIAFAEAFRPLAPWIEARAGVAFDPRMLSLPGTLLLTIVALRGADIGVRALWVVVAVLATSLSVFFAGGPPPGAEVAGVQLTERVAGHDPFMLVLAIAQSLQIPGVSGMENNTALFEFSAHDGPEEQRSAAADLVICGFTDERLREKGPDFFLRHPGLRDVLWVQAREQVLIE